MIYERYKRLIQDKINEGELTQEFIEKTTYRLSEFYEKKKITKEEYEELLNMLEV